MAITKITTPELFDFSATNTALQLPTGTTAQRPGTLAGTANPVAGEWRYNTTLSYVEFYDGANWFQIDTEAIPGPTPVGNENFNVNTYFGYGGTQTLDAKFNEAATFAGSGGSPTSRIDLPQSILGSGTTKIWSTSFWFNTSSATEQYMNNTAAFSSGTGYSVYIRATTGYLQFSVSNGGGGNSEEGWRYEVAAVNDGNWHNVVATYSSAGGSNDAYLYLYLDGADVTGPSTPINGMSQGSGPTWSSFTTPRISLGNWAASTANVPLLGRMDQVRFYNTELTALQAEDCWTDETTTTAATLDFPAGAGCIAAYQLDGDASDVSGTYGGTTIGVGYTGLKFSADLAWIKQRSLPARDHVLFDTVRGPATNLSILYPNLTNAEDAGGSTFLSSISSNALNLGSSIYVNGSSLDYVAWCWKAPDAFSHSASGSGSGSTLASTGKSNQAAGFSIVKFAVPSVSNGESRKIKHNLGGIPELIIYKTLNSSQATSWFVNTPSIGNDHELFFNTNDAKSGTTTRWNNTTPDITTFDIGPAILDYTGGSNTDYYGGDTIAYCFKSIPGYSKVGTYLGDQQNPGPTINTGFKPGWLLVKCIDRSDNWVILDSKRGDGNALFPNLTSEQFPNYNTDFNATGFQIKNLDYSMNFSGDEYLYMAFAE